MRIYFCWTIIVAIESLKAKMSGMMSKGRIEYTLVYFGCGSSYSVANIDPLRYLSRSAHASMYKYYYLIRTVIKFNEYFVACIWSWSFRMQFSAKPPSASACCSGQQFANVWVRGWHWRHVRWRHERSEHFRVSVLCWTRSVYSNFFIFGSMENRYYYLFKT